MPGVHLTDIPVMQIFNDKRFTLRAAVGGSSSHFVSYIKDGDGWIFYNGMASPSLKKKSIDSLLFNSKLKRYPIYSISMNFVQIFQQQAQEPLYQLDLFLIKCHIIVTPTVKFFLLVMMIIHSVLC